MSAFVLGTEHIDYLVTAGLSLPSFQGPMSWYYDGKRRELTSDTADHVGQTLLDQNIRSVRALYDEDDKDTPQEYRYRKCGSVSPVQVLKALDCYQYQSCETPDWLSTEACCIVQALRARMIHTLPGYDAAAWVISGEITFGEVQA